MTCNDCRKCQSFSLHICNPVIQYGDINPGQTLARLMAEPMFTEPMLTKGVL